MALQAKNEIELHRTEILALWKKYQTTRFTKEEATLAEQFWTERKQLVATNDSILADLEGGRFDAASSKFEQQRSLFKPMMEKADELLALQLRVAEETVSAAQAKYSLDRNIAVATILFALGLTDGESQRRRQLVAGILRGRLSELLYLIAACPSGKP